MAAISPDRLCLCRRRLIFEAVSPHAVQRRTPQEMQQPTIWSPPGVTAEEEFARTSFWASAQMCDTTEKRLSFMKECLLVSPDHAGDDGHPLRFHEHRLPPKIRSWNVNSNDGVNRAFHDIFFAETNDQALMDEAPRHAEDHARNRVNWCMDHFGDLDSTYSPDKKNYQISHDILNQCKYVVDAKISDYLERNDQLHGRDGLKLWEHYDHCYIGFAAALIAKHWFGKDQSMDSVKSLAHYALIPENHEIFYCGVIPSCCKIIGCMGNDADAEFGLETILYFPIKSFNQSLKKRFMNGGVWSVREAIHQLQIEGANELHDDQAKNMCRGVEVTSLHMAYHVFKNFGVVAKPSKCKALLQKKWITNGERQTISRAFHDSVPMFFTLTNNTMHR